MSRIAGFLVTVSVAFALAAAGAADRPWHTYREICEKFGLIELFAVPAAQRDDLRILFKVLKIDQQADPLVLTIQGAGRIQRISADANGYIEIPLDANLLAENPTVLVNLPQGTKVSFTADLRPRLPIEPQLDYVRLMGGIAKANAYIRQQAGMLGFLVPTLHKLVLRYASADGQKVTIGEGPAARQFAVDSSAQIVIPFDPALFSANVAVAISHVPKDADFAP